MKTKIIPTPDSATVSPRRLYPPHFFQPLLVGFRRRFKIPVNFMKNYLNEVLISEKKKMKKSSNATPSPPLSVLLRSHNREWVVRLEGKRYLGKGWPKFVGQYYDDDDDDDDSKKKMEVGDILVFKHIGNLVFDVSVFHPTTGLQKLPNHHSNVNNNDHTPHTVREKEQSTTSKSKPFFDSVIKMNSNIQRKAMYVPIAFVREIGLESNCQMILKDDRGRRWEMDAKFYSRRSCVYLTKGWYEFQIGNDLKLGDHLRFRLLRNGQRPIILVSRLTKKNRDVDQMGKVKTEVEEGEEIS